MAAEPGQKVKEVGVSDDTGMLATVKHILQRFAEEKEHILSCLAGKISFLLRLYWYIGSFFGWFI